MKTTLAASFILATFAGGALAQDSELQRCRALKDAGQRLACYDAIPLGMTPAPALAPPPAAAPKAAAPAGAATAAAAPAAAPAPSIWQRFGFEYKAQPDEPPSMESTIPGLFEGWQPRSTIKLANGQVWQVTEETSRMTYIENPKVKITRGAFGSFFMEIERVGQAPRVRRVQ